MSSTFVLGKSRARAWKRVQKYVSGGAAAALLAGMLVVAGVGMQSALAAPDAPAVTATPAQTLILGEDTSVDISITNESGDPTYNLSVTVMLPDTVDLIEPSPFGPRAGPKTSRAPAPSRTCRKTRRTTCSPSRR